MKSYEDVMVDYADNEKRIYDAEGNLIAIEREDGVTECVNED